MNEPAYPDGTTGEQIAAYANALLAGIRRSGTCKPVFYSATWNKHNECVPMLKTDGVSGVYAGWKLLHVAKQISQHSPGPAVGLCVEIRKVKSGRKRKVVKSEGAVGTRFLVKCPLWDS